SGDLLAALEFASAYRLAVEEQGRYRLTMGLFEAWLRWTPAPGRAPAPRALAAPPPSPNPSTSEIQALEKLMLEGFPSPTDLELLARQMHVPLATVARIAAPLPIQIGDLVDWAVKHRRFWELLETVRIERPGLFSNSAGTTQVVHA